MNRKERRAKKQDDDEAFSVRFNRELQQAIARALGAEQARDEHIPELVCQLGFTAAVFAIQMSVDETEFVNAMQSYYRTVLRQIDAQASEPSMPPTPSAIIIPGE